MSPEFPASASRAGRRLIRQLYLAVIALLGLAAVGASFADLLGQPHDWQHLGWLKLAVLTLIGGWFSVDMPLVSVRFSLSETFVLAGTLLFGPAIGVILALLDVAVVSLRSYLTKKRVRWTDAIVGLATPPLSVWLAARLVGITGPIPDDGSITLSFIGTLALFTAAYFLLNTGLASVARSLEPAVGLIGAWWTNIKDTSVSFAASASIAAFLVNARGVDLVLLGVSAPLMFLIYLTYSWSAKQIETERQKNVELNRVFLSTIAALTHAIDAKDQVTHGHIRRVQVFTMALAEALNVLDEKQLDALRAAALLHDTGKLAVPEYILLKPGRLTASEFERMKAHAAAGADILKTIDFPYPVEPIVRHHHENWDGSGYPDGLKGEAIPLGARILAVVDCYDALRSDRPHRLGMLRHQAEQILRDRRGTMYDPAIVDEFLRLLDKLEAEHIAPAVEHTDDAASSLSPVQVDVLRATTAEERVFAELTRELSGASTLAEGATTLFRSLRRVVPAVCFALFVPQPNTNEVAVQVSSSVGGPPLDNLRIPIGERTSGWAFAHQRMVFNSDAGLELGQLVAGFAVPLKYALAVPVTNGDCVAVITAYGSEPFDESHRRMLESAANLLVTQTVLATTA